MSKSCRQQLKIAGVSFNSSWTPFIVKAFQLGEINIVSHLTFLWNKFSQKDTIIKNAAAL